ncbi:MAG: hypothetical protein WCI92_03945 [Bacteroidota bacterium]
MKKKKPDKDQAEAEMESTVEEIQRLIKKQELQTAILKKIIENKNNSNQSLNQ